MSSPNRHEARPIGLPEQGRTLISTVRFDSLRKRYADLKATHRALRESWGERGEIIKALADGSEDVLIAAAAKATFRADREQDRANAAECRENLLESVRADTLEALGRALVKANAPMCRECCGSGKIAAEIEGCSSDPSCVSPPVTIEFVDCDDCAGIGREWV